MDRAGHFGLQCAENQPLSLKPRFSGKCRRYDSHMKMRFTLRTSAGMAFVECRLVLNIEFFRCKCLGQLGMNCLGYGHSLTPRFVLVMVRHRASGGQAPGHLV